MARRRINGHQICLAPPPARQGLPPQNASVSPAPDPTFAPSTLPCVLDIEASGFGRNSYPIEIGFVLPDGRATCMLVRPPEGWTHWSVEAERIHGITRGTLVAHGHTPREVAQVLNQELGGLTVYCDGWAHDYAWLNALFEEADLRPKFRLEPVGKLLGEHSLSQLDQARREAMAEMGLTRHRASNDARALQRAMMRVAEPI
jgi:hypothetical protein